MKTFVITVHPQYYHAIKDVSREPYYFANDADEIILFANELVAYYLIEELRKREYALSYGEICRPEYAIKEVSRDDDEASP